MEGNDYLFVLHRFDIDWENQNQWGPDADNCLTIYYRQYETNSYIWTFNSTTKQWANPAPILTTQAQGAAYVQTSEQLGQRRRHFLAVANYISKPNGMSGTGVSVYENGGYTGQGSMIYEFIPANNTWSKHMDVLSYRPAGVEGFTFDNRTFFLFVNFCCDGLYLYEYKPNLNTFALVQNLYMPAESAAPYTIGNDHFLAVKHQFDLRIYKFDHECNAVSGIFGHTHPDYIDCPFKLYSIPEHTPIHNQWTFTVSANARTEPAGVPVGQIFTNTALHPTQSLTTLKTPLSGHPTKIVVNAARTNYWRVTLKVSTVLNFRHTNTRVTSGDHSGLTVRDITSQNSGGYIFFDFAALLVTQKTFTAKNDFILGSCSKGASNHIISKIQSHNTQASCEAASGTWGEETIPKSNIESVTIVATSPDATFTTTHDLQIGGTIVTKEMISAVEKGEHAAVDDVYFAGHYDLEHTSGEVSHFVTGPRGFRRHILALAKSRQSLCCENNYDSGMCHPPLRFFLLMPSSFCSKICSKTQTTKKLTFSSFVYTFHFFYTVLIDVTNPTADLKLVQEIYFYRPQASTAFTIGNKDYLFLGTVHIEREYAHVSHPAPIVELNYDGGGISGFPSGTYTGDKIESVLFGGSIGASVYFKIGSSRIFLAVSYFRNNNSRRLKMTIYEYNSRRLKFELFQLLGPTHSPKNLKMLTIESNVYLILSQDITVDPVGTTKNHQTQIFMYCSTSNKFVQHQLLDSPYQNTRSPTLATFEDQGNYYIVEGSSVWQVAGTIYIFNEVTGLFERQQELAGNENGIGTRAWKKIIPMTIEDDVYLAVMVDPQSFGVVPWTKNFLLKKDRGTNVFQFYSTIEGHRDCISGSGVTAAGWKIGELQFLAVGCAHANAVHIYQFELGAGKFKLWKTIPAPNVVSIEYYRGASGRSFIVVVAHNDHKYRIYEVGSYTTYNWPARINTKIWSGEPIVKVSKYPMISANTTLPARPNCGGMVLSSSSNVSISHVTVKNTPLNPICVETTQGSATIKKLSVNTLSKFGIRIGQKSYGGSIHFTNVVGTLIFDPTLNAATTTWQPESDPVVNWYVAVTGGSDFNLTFGPSTSAPFATVQMAINRAGNGDTVNLMVGVHTGGTDCTSLNSARRRCNTNIDYRGKEITVTGIAGSSARDVVVDCGHSTNAWPSLPHRGFGFFNNESAKSVLRGLTIRNCRALKGVTIASCYASTGTNTVCNALLFPPVPTHAGGGIAIVNASPSLININIVNCKAGIGGGIYIGAHASPSLININATGCIAAAGGAVAMVDTTAVSWEGGTIDLSNAVDTTTYGRFENCVNATESLRTEVSPGGVFQNIQTRGAASWHSFTIKGDIGYGDKGYLIVDNQLGPNDVIYELDEEQQRFVGIVNIPHPKVIYSIQNDHAGSDYTYIKPGQGDGKHLLIKTPYNEDFIYVYWFKIFSNYAPCGSINVAGVCDSPANSVELWQKIDLTSLNYMNPNILEGSSKTNWRKHQSADAVSPPTNTIDCANVEVLAAETANHTCFNKRGASNAHGFLGANGNHAAQRYFAATVGHKSNDKIHTGIWLYEASGIPTSERRFKLIQLIYTPTATSIETFVIGNDLFLIIGLTPSWCCGNQHGPTTQSITSIPSSRVNTQLYKWDGTAILNFPDGKFVPYDFAADNAFVDPSITGGLQNFFDWEYIRVGPPEKRDFKQQIVDESSVGVRHFLAVANRWGPATYKGEKSDAPGNIASGMAGYKTDSKIFEWVLNAGLGSFEEFQALPTLGAQDLESWTFNGETYLLVANSKDDSRSYSKTVRVANSHVASKSYGTANNDYVLSFLNNNCFKWDATSESFVPAFNILGHTTVNWASLIVNGRVFIVNAQRAKFWTGNRYTWDRNSPDCIFDGLISCSGAASSTVHKTQAACEGDSGTWEIKHQHVCRYEAGTTGGVFSAGGGVTSNTNEEDCDANSGSWELTIPKISYDMNGPRKWSVDATGNIITNQRAYHLTWGEDECAQFGGVYTSGNYAQRELDFEADQILDSTIYEVTTGNVGFSMTKSHEMLNIAYTTAIETFTINGQSYLMAGSHLRYGLLVLTLY